MSDLKRLHRLLDELQPQFLAIQQSVSPPGAPVVSLTDYGQNHVTWNLPQLDVQSNGDPVILTITGLPSFDFAQGQVGLAPDLQKQSTTQVIVPAEWSDMQTALPNPPDHAATVSDTKITVTALDMITGQQSNPISFNFLGFGPDPTLKNGGFPASPLQLADWVQLNNVFTMDPSVPTIQELLLEKQAAAQALIDPPPAINPDPPPPGWTPDVKPLQAAMAAWHPHHQDAGIIGQQTAMNEGTQLFGPSDHSRGDHNR